MCLLTCAGLSAPRSTCCLVFPEPHSASPASRGPWHVQQLTIIAQGDTGSGKTHTMQGSHADPGLLHHIVHAVHASSEMLGVADIRVTAVQYVSNRSEVRVTTC